MTDRIPLDDMTSDQLDQLYDDLAAARQELQQHAEAESADAAAGSYAGRAERVETRLARVQRLLDSGPIGTCCAHLLRAALAHDEPAIAHPEPWLHVAFTSPDETTANTSALAIADHLAAEFDGVRMRITTNAVEAGPLAPAEEGDLAQSGINTPGCDCGHDGMGVSWHGDDCPWRRSVLDGAAPEQPARTTPDNPAICCVCGGGPVVYRNYREQPFCWPCADCPCNQDVCVRTGINANAVAAPAWTPPPPGSTHEQLPESLLALIRDRLPDYTSTACQTADTLACAACYPGSGVPRPQYDEIREHAERLHSRCRLNNKFTGQLRACGCHPEEQP